MTENIGWSDLWAIINCLNVDILIQLWVHCEQTAVAVCSSILVVTLCNLLRPLVTCSTYGSICSFFNVLLTVHLDIIV
jgi:hypothetical protein